MLAVMSGMAISRETTADRGDYGIDAPRVLIAIARPGAAAMAAGAALGWATAPVAVLAAVVSSQTWRSLVPTARDGRREAPRLGRGPGFLRMVGD
jgi:hypothetical protein